MYKRTYTLDQVHRLICSSEGRNSPKSGQAGHTVSLHADGRTGTTADQRSKTVIILAGTIEESRAMDPADGFDVITGASPGVDSRFTTRLDLVKAVCWGLNSPAGQNKLAEFDSSSSLQRVTFTAPISPSISNIERYTKSTGVIERGLTASAVFLVIDRLGTSASGEIHIQTAFPKNVS
ncbi:MAG: hypothetical protein R3C59_18820 [Planctomycetaceae bacterium]